MEQLTWTDDRPSPIVGAAGGLPEVVCAGGTTLVHIDGRPVLRGLQLRYLLTVILLEASTPLSLHDLVEAVAREGFVLRGRPSKVVSDALRWEVGRGRVVRHGRGTYGTGTMPRQTRSRIRQRVRGLRAHVAVAPCAPGAVPEAR